MYSRSSTSGCTEGPLLVCLQWNLCIDIGRYFELMGGGGGGGVSKNFLFMCHHGLEIYL